MPSPVIPRLNQVIADYGIKEPQNGYGPGHYQMYSLLKTQGFADGSHVFETTGTDGLGGIVEIPFKHDVTVLIMPPNGGKHRVMVKCDCGQFVPFGRLHQHKCK